MNTDHRPVHRDDPRWLMSALADGEADADEARRALAAWAEGDAAARDRWHAYHLIGDVLRSDELAATPAADRDFCRRLGARLDAEPLPPAAMVDRPGPRRRWPFAAPVAMAAGVLAAATALFVLQDAPSTGAVAPRVAAAPSAATAAPAATTVAQAVPAPAAAVDVGRAGRAMLRDAQLDRYLRAHREYGVAQPVSLPGGSARSIETVAFER